MYGASLTKMVFTYHVMQLVDEGKLKLDTRIKDNLDKPLTECGDHSDEKFLGKYGPYKDLDPTKPGTIVQSGTTFFTTTVAGQGSQAGIFFTRYDGAAGTHTTPALIDNQTVGHQFFPDISADGGVLHVLWCDSRLDPNYSPARPIGNSAAGVIAPSLDVFGAKSTDSGTTWTTPVRLTDVTSNANYEQFDNRSVPFAGDYLWITSLGNFSFGTWTDYRNTVRATDPRETTEDEDNATADVHQCRVFSALIGAWSGDLCPHEGGIDQNIYGDHTP